MHIVVVLLLICELMFTFENNRELENVPVKINGKICVIVR